MSAVNPTSRPTSETDRAVTGTAVSDESPITVCGQVIEFPHHASPHDPKYAPEGRTYADGQPCNRDCPGAWPCAIRKRQREVIKWLAGDLRGALYRRVGGHEYARWMNPLDSVTVLYGSGETGLWCQVLYGDRVERETLNADEWFLGGGVL